MHGLAHAHCRLTPHLLQSKDSKQKDGCAPQHGHQPRRQVTRLWDQQQRLSYLSLSQAWPAKHLTCFCLQGKDSKKKDGFALSVAISPDGRLLACGGSNGGVSLFDVATGKYLATLEGHYKPVRSLTFTPGEMKSNHTTPLSISSSKGSTCCLTWRQAIYGHERGPPQAGEVADLYSMGCRPTQAALSNAGVKFAGSSAALVLPLEQPAGVLRAPFCSSLKLLGIAGYRWGITG